MGLCDELWMIKKMWMAECGRWGDFGENFSHDSVKFDINMIIDWQLFNFVQYTKFEHRNSNVHYKKPFFFQIY